MIDKYEGFHKVAHNGGTLTEVVLFDGKQQVNVIIDDSEYQLPTDSPYVRKDLTRDDIASLSRMPVESDWRDRWLVEWCGTPVIGCKGVAIKGRKRGGSGIVRRVYDVCNRYGKVLSLAAEHQQLQTRCGHDRYEVVPAFFMCISGAHNISRRCRCYLARS